MGTIFIRTLIIYSLVLIAIRLMGKREIGQLQPYELVVTIMIADVASLPMQNVSISLFQGVVPILGLLFAQVFVSVISYKSKSINRFISGKPTVLVSKGKIIEENLKKQKYSLETLLEQIRVKGYQSILELDYVVLETSGEVSVLPKTSEKSITIKDMNLKANYTGYSRTIIMDGILITKNLEDLGHDEKWLLKQLKKYNLKIKDTLLFTLDEGGNIYCQGRNESI